MRSALNLAAATARIADRSSIWAASTAAAAATGSETRNPVTPGSMISGIEPRWYAMTGVPAAIASTTDRPKGSSKSMGCSRASAPPSRAERSRRSDRPDVAHPIPVDPRRDEVIEVGLVLNGTGDHQHPPGPLGDVDRVRGALVGMDAAEDDELVTAGRGELDAVEVDPVIDGPAVVQVR